MSDGKTGSPRSLVHLPLEERARLSTMEYENFMLFYVKRHDSLCESDRKFMAEQLVLRLGTDKKEIVDVEIGKYIRKYKQYK